MILDLLLGLTKLPGSEFSSSGGSVSPLLALVSGDASHLRTPSSCILLSIPRKPSPSACCQMHTSRCAIQDALVYFASLLGKSALLAASFATEDCFLSIQDADSSTLTAVGR